MAGERPTGTVTFLFTDIEGSTRLWERQPDAMREALARHDDIMRAVLAGNRWYVFATGGDGFAVAFADVNDALGAAVAAQRAMSRTEWPRDTELRVRMGLHTGSAEERGGDYFGQTVNRCARLMSAAHGGQVVVTEATHSVADAGSCWLDLGEHRLRDLATADRVYQVMADGLVPSFPTLRTVDTLPGNLPRQLTSFVGRAEEIADLVELIEAAPLVTLTGVGGVGKTRLAMEVAAAVQAEFENGAWLVELAAIADGDDVVSAVSAALGIKAPQGRDALDPLIDGLRLRRMLLVLDNCEHLTGAVVTLANRILADAPGVKVLVTSSEGLGVRGEHLRLVPSLPTESSGGSATDLFCDRARAVRSDFALDAENRATTAELCERLDGIPLAIELAAARVRSMTPAEILPSSTLFRAGESLQLVVQGADLFDHVALGHAYSAEVNKGTHAIHTGGEYDSHLLVPCIPR